jgi:cold-inducible RNA-binding protein
MSTQHTVFLGNLPFTTQKNDLQETFEKFGTITEIHIPVDRQTGKARGFAFVTFETDEAAQSALSMDGQDLNGRQIKVNMALGKKESSEGGAPRSGGFRSDRGGAPRSGGFRSDRGGDRRGGFGGNDGGNRW